MFLIDLPPASRIPNLESRIRYQFKHNGTVFLDTRIYRITSKNHPVMRFDTSISRCSAPAIRCVGLLATFLLLAPSLRAQEIKLTAEDAASGDEFGTSVALSGDYALVGARFEGPGGDDFGAAYVFVRTADGWVQQAKLIADDGEDGDRFGISVGIDGSYAVVGASGEDAGGTNAGAAYVFVRDGETWTQQTKLTAGDADEDDRFGVAVAISGVHILVGATGDDDLKDDAGAAYVFVRDGETWSEQVKLNASDAVNGDAFGNAVALDGTTGVIGAVGDNFPDGNSGSAYVFERDGAVWTEQTKIFASDGVPDNLFGNAVAIRGDYIIAGMSRDDDEGEDAGSAYVFVREAGLWSQQTKLTASDATAGDEFGNAVAIDGVYAVVGAPGNDDGGEGAGSVYVFRRDGATWNEQAEITASDGEAGDEFGKAVAVSGITALVGAPIADLQLAPTGAAYVLALAAPAAPQPVSPPNRESGLPTNVTLEWNPVDGADSYHVQVATTSGFTTLVFDAPDQTVTTFQATGLTDNTTYFWRVAGVNAAGTGSWSATRQFTVGTDTAIEQVDDDVPAAYHLDANYPNPFNPTTTLSFALPKAAHVTLTVYDATGAAVITLVDRRLAAGRYTTAWEATGLASGVYVAQMRAESFVQTRKMILLK